MKPISGLIVAPVRAIAALIFGRATERMKVILTKATVIKRL